MSRRLAFVGLLAVFCIVSVIFGGALLTEALGPSHVEELLENQEDFTEGELDRLGSAEDPIGYGGDPGPITDHDDLRLRYGAVEQQYWRTASYDTYTGTTWQSTRADREYDGAINGDEADETRTFAIESWGLNEAVPAPWQPVAVDDAVADSVRILGDGALSTESGVAPGQTYTVTSEVPAWTYEELEESDFTDEPPSVYTDLPEGLPDRLVERADAITDDARTPYGTAVLIERWLKLNKDYAVDVHTQSDWSVDEFVFERDAGTSELFASAMVTMLRTQDVNARYVTGFAPGEFIETGEQVVRGTHAHAWVEVYFEDVGWVQFDPTPPDRTSEREEPLDSSVEEASWDSVSVGPESLSHEGIKSNEPRHSPLHLEATETSDDWKPVEEIPTIEFLDDAGMAVETLVPGTTVTIRFTQDDEPVVGHRISLDGTVVGVTDDAGEVTVELPFTATIELLIEAPTEDTDEGEDTDEEENGDDEQANGEDETDEDETDEDETDEDETDEDETDEDDTDDGDQNGEENGTASDSEGVADGTTEITLDEAGLGALDPGDSTGVGGEVGLDDSTFGNTDTSVHLLVRSSDPAYWRTEAYDHFTGAGWQRTGDSQDPSTLMEETDTDRNKIEYEVTLQQRATGLPTVWRPFDISGVDDVQASELGGLHSDDILPIGTTYEGISYAPTDDVSELRAVDGDIPDDIADRYTQLPDGTTDRLIDLSADLVEDQPTTFDAASTVQNWLRDEHDYSLEVSATGENIADEFVFEMGAGYCEYFATAMVAMLRSQDIPARYVVGYSTGDEIGDGLYEVRGMNAHAWVEVYFPGVGWVTFDPTPGDDRLAAQEAALQEEDPDAEYSPTGEGSPGEVFRPGDIQRHTDQIIDESDYEVGGYVDHLDASDEVRIGEEPEPLSDQIRFIVTATSDDGAHQALGEEPGVVEVPGVVEQPGVVEKLGDAEEPNDGDSPAFASISGGDWEDRSTITRPSGGLASNTMGAVGGSSRADAPSVPASQFRIDDNASFNLTLATDIDVNVGNETRSGQPVSVQAMIEDVPVPDASVEARTADGGVVLTTTSTDSMGAASLELPYHEMIEVVVRRGEATGQTTHEVDVDLELSLADEPHPGRNVTATVTSHGEPAAGVGLDPGLQETDTNGSAVVSLPYASNGTITAERGEAADSVAYSFDLFLSAGSVATPGENLTVELTADGTPVAAVPIAPGGVETDANGTATIKVPYAAEVDVLAERDNLLVERSIGTDGELDIQASGFALPGREVDVTVTLDGTPVADAEVAFGEDRVATTDSAGTASVRIPLDPRASATLVATRGELQAETDSGATRGWLWALVLTAVAGLATLYVSSAIRARRESSPVQAAISWIIPTARRLQAHLERIGAILATRLRDSSVREIPAAIITGIGRLLRSPVATVRNVSLLALIRRILSDTDSTDSSPAEQPAVWMDASGTATAGTRNQSPIESGASDHSRIQAGFHRLATLVDAPTSETPSEVASRATQNGLPEQPVERITHTYLEHRYGATGSADEAAETIEGDLDRLERGEVDDR